MLQRPLSVFEWQRGCTASGMSDGCRRRIWHCAQPGLSTGLLDGLERAFADDYMEE
jgi:hypothetical protein